MPKYIDLTGEAYGNLKVLRKDKSKKRTYWICECNCGNKISVRQDNLKSGRIISCGCYHKNIASKKSKNKKYNNYKIDSNVTYIYTHGNKAIIIDKEDFDKVKDYCWSESSNGYAQARTIEDSIILMHRLIMNPSDNELIDHENHNTLDNRKENLRICTQDKNMANQKTSKANTSGYKGVYWSKEKGKWYSKIGYKNKNIHLGYFSNIDDAIKAREEAEIKYFGKYRYKE